MDPVRRVRNGCTWCMRGRSQSRASRHVASETQDVATVERALQVGAAAARGFAEGAEVARGLRPVGRGPPRRMNNPNFALDPRRLSVRNLPTHVDANKLREVVARNLLRSLEAPRRVWGLVFGRGRSRIG